MDAKKRLRLLVLLFKSRKREHIRFVVVLILIFTILQITLLHCNNLWFSSDSYMNHSEETISYRQLRVQSSLNVAELLAHYYDINNIEMISKADFIIEITDYKDRWQIIDFIEGKQLGQVVIDDAIESTIKQYEQLQSILATVLFFILVFLLIILNLFTSQLISRRKIEIALWMTVGYTRGQILNLMWSQIFCFMLMGFAISLPFTTAAMKILEIYMRHFCVTAISANPSVYFYICLTTMLLVINIYVIWSIHRRTKKIQPKEMFIKEL